MSDPATVRARVVVTGVVQGVFFRGTCRREALNRGVAGWVRNNANGDVEAVFEGPATAVDGLIGWMRQGPRNAHVESADVTMEAPEGLSGFWIR